ncbi:ttcA, partial [Symbiodinium pilosum]
MDLVVNVRGFCETRCRQSRAVESSSLWTHKDGSLRVCQHVEDRGLRLLLDRWAAQPRIEVLGGSPEAGQSRAAIVSFMIRYGNKARGGLYLHYNYVVALLNDLFGIQARGGCACAGPYAQKLLGIDADLARTFDEALLRSAQEVLRP